MSGFVPLPDLRNNEIRTSKIGITTQVSYATRSDIQRLHFR